MEYAVKDYVNAALGLEPNWKVVAGEVAEPTIGRLAVAVWEGGYAIGTLLVAAGEVVPSLWSNPAEEGECGRISLPEGEHVEFYPVLRVLNPDGVHVRRAA